MSFICQSCGSAVAHGVKPCVKTITRPKEYVKVDPETGEILLGSAGFEVEHEIKMCPECAGIKRTPEVVPNFGKHLLLAKGYHAHVSDCDGIKTTKVKNADGSVEKVKEPCPICERVVQLFKGFPLAALSLALEDRKVKPFKNPMWAVAVENVIDRTIHTSKRAANDVTAAFAVLKPFEERQRQAQGRGQA